MANCCLRCRLATRHWLLAIRQLGRRQRLLDRGLQSLVEIVRGDRSDLFKSDHAVSIYQVTLGSAEVLEPGMVFALESPYFELGWGGLQLEDTYLVTAQGFERLTTLPQTIVPSATEVIPA